MSVTGPDSLNAGQREGDVQKQGREQEREEAVSAAVGMVVASARHGVITLCASVAHIIREKIRLEQKVSELERRVLVLENSNSSNDSGVICQCDSHASVLPESPSTLRCGSAPPSILSGPSRKLSSNDPHIVQEVCQNCESGANQFCTACLKKQADQRNSLASHWSKRDEVTCGFLRSKSTDANANRKESVCVFSRGHDHASTRSLNLHRVPSMSRFMRRKYSTISLRRVQRAGLSSKGSSSGTLSQQSSSMSSGSEEWGEDGSRRGSSGSRSYVVTVAEVYTPSPHNTSESAAVKLLARKLASVMQEDEFEEDQTCCLDGSDTLQVPPLSPTSSVPNHEYLCAPHPLSGCECVVCMRLLSDSSCAVYSLTTSEGSLLPRGSTILIRGDKIGTVVYFGHRRHSEARQAIWYQPPLESSAATHVATSTCTKNKGVVSETDFGGSNEVTTHPVGVTITLWPPDQGEMFVPLSDVICQLDEEEEIEKDYPYSSTLEDSGTCIFQGESVLVGQCTKESIDPDLNNLHAHIDQQNRIEIINDTDFKNSKLHTQSENSLPLIVEPWGVDPENVPMESSGSRTPKNNAYSMGYSKDPESLMEAQNPGVSDCEEEKMYKNPCRLEFWDERERGLSNQPIQFSSCRYSSNTDYQKNLDNEPELSLYDTSDSAISLSSRKPQSYKKTTERGTHLSRPSSVSEVDRFSPHFGDTWDSGCYTHRERFGSLSLEQLSDVEFEGTHDNTQRYGSFGQLSEVERARENIQRRYGSTSPEHLSDTECERRQQRSSWVQSLQDTFDIMWDRYNGSREFSDNFTSDSRSSTDYSSNDVENGNSISDPSLDLHHSKQCSNHSNNFSPHLKNKATFDYGKNDANYYPLTKPRFAENAISEKTTMDSGVLGLRNYSQERRKSSVNLYFLDNCSVGDSEV